MDKQAERRNARQGRGVMGCVCVLFAIPTAAASKRQRNDLERGMGIRENTNTNKQTDEASVFSATGTPLRKIRVCVPY